MTTANGLIARMVSVMGILRQLTRCASPNVIWPTRNQPSSIIGMQSADRRRAGLLGTIAVLLVATGMYVWKFGFATVAMIEAQYAGKRVPIVSKVPVSLSDSSFTHSIGKKLVVCGFGFDVPWSDLNESKTKSNATKQVMYFDSGLVLAVTCSPPRTFVDTFLSAGKITPDDFQQVFGNEALQSDYVLTRLMLETTPNKLTLSTGRKDASATLSMLVVKSIATPAADSGMFFVHTDQFDGFQYENPALHPKRVLVDLFSPDQSLEFTFLLNYQGASPRISQADINRIIQTVRKEGTFRATS
jgi:hypothetical protein